MTDIAWHEDRNPTLSEAWSGGHPYGLFLVCYRVYNKAGVEEDRYTTCVWHGDWDIVDFGCQRRLLHRVVKWAQIR